MINAIFAMDEKGGIGKDGTLPWERNLKDLRWFKIQTQNSIVVMGRNTWDDPVFPNPLPNRHNVVITSRGMNAYENTTTLSISNARTWLLRNQHKTIFLIGGSRVFNSYWDLVETFYVTEFKGDYSCDTFISPNNLKTLSTAKETFRKEDDDLTFKILQVVKDNEYRV